MAKVIWHGLIVVLLTVVTQIGGIAWLVGLWLRRPFLCFLPIYVVLTIAVGFIVPVFGRVPLPCSADGALQSQSYLYCALNRHYVTPEMYDLATDLSDHMEQKFPGTITQTLDGGFPFVTGFPLLPHLSHDDGEKLDFAFYWADENGEYLPGVNRSLIGYWGYAKGPTECPVRWSDLRWDFPVLNARWPAYEVEYQRLSVALRYLAEDVRTGKILVEPYLSKRAGVSHDKIRFQGCRAARHDDHIHVQL